MVLCVFLEVFILQGLGILWDRHKRNAASARVSKKRAAKKQRQRGKKKIAKMYT